MFCSFPGFLVKSQESFTNDIISNLCRFNDNDKNIKKKKKKNRNNDTKTLVKNLMISDGDSDSGIACYEIAVLHKD